MGLFSRIKPKIKIQTSKRDGFSGWLKCTSCQELIHEKELGENQNCCPKCDYHYRLSVEERIGSLADPKSFVVHFTHLQPTDPLHFVDTEPYSVRLKKSKEKTGHDEAIVAGSCTIGGYPVCLGVLNFHFMGGSMGSVVGERLTLLVEMSIEKKIPLIVISTSGGARMQESTLSLMQMAKTSAALAKLHEAKVPFISILTNPTTGGVIASFASLGDIILAEPNALLCFTGPRVIEQTIGQSLPPGAQKSEFLLKHGMIDSIVHRADLKNRLAQILYYFESEERDEAGNSIESGGGSSKGKIHSFPFHHLKE